MGSCLFCFHCHDAQDSLPEQIQDVLLAVAFMAGDGLHILLRLLSLHLCDEYPSLPKKDEKRKRADGHCPESSRVPKPQHHRYGWPAELMPQTCVAVG